MGRELAARNGRMVERCPDCGEPIGRHESHTCDPEG